MSRRNTRTYRTYIYSMERVYVNSSMWMHAPVQRQGDPNSGNDILRACESCNPKTRQGVKRLLQGSVGRAHQWMDCGRKVEKEHSRLRVWKSAPSSSRRKSCGCLHIQPELLPGRRKSWMWAPHLTGGSINTLQKKTKTEEEKSVCDSSFNTVSIQNQLQCVNMLSFCQIEIKVTSNLIQQLKNNCDFLFFLWT